MNFLALLRSFFGPLLRRFWPPNVTVRGYTSHANAGRHNTSQSRVLQRDVMTCAELRRQRDLSRTDTQYKFVGFEDKNGSPFQTYDEAHVFLGGSIKGGTYYDETGAAIS